MTWTSFKGKKDDLSQLPRAMPLNGDLKVLLETANNLERDVTTCCSRLQANIMSNTDGMDLDVGRNDGSYLIDKNQANIELLDRTSMHTRIHENGAGDDSINFLGPKDNLKEKEDELQMMKKVLQARSHDTGSKS